MASLDGKQHLKGQGGVDESGKGQTTSKQNKNEQNNQMNKKDITSRTEAGDNTSHEGAGQDPEPASGINTGKGQTPNKQNTNEQNNQMNKKDIASPPGVDGDSIHEVGLEQVSGREDDSSSHAEEGKGTTQQGADQRPKPRVRVDSTHKVNRDDTTLQGADLGLKSASDSDSSSHTEGEVTPQQGADQRSTPGICVNSCPNVDGDGTPKQETKSGVKSLFPAVGGTQQQQGADHEPNRVGCVESKKDIEPEHPDTTDDQVKRMAKQIRQLKDELEKKKDDINAHVQKNKEETESILKILDEKDKKLQKTGEEMQREQVAHENDMTDKNNEIKHMETRVEYLESRMKTEIGKLNDTVLQKDEQMKHLQKKVDDGLIVNEETAKNFQEAADKISELDRIIKDKEELQKSMSKQIDDLKKERNNVKSNCDNQEKNILDLRTKLKTLKSNCDNQEKTILDVRTKLKTSKQEQEEIKKSMSKTIEDKDKECKKLQNDVNVLTKNNNKNKLELNKYANGYTEAMFEVSRFEAENKDLRGYKKMYPTLKQEIETLRNTTRSLEAEKETLLLRLSKIAGANLTYNNPNIADLSDEKRPTKLAEEFSELYDNEWTDAFDEVEGDDDEIKTRVLYDLLEHAYAYCVKLSVGHDEAIQGSFTTLNYIRTLPQSAEYEYSTRQEHNHKMDKPPAEEMNDQQADQRTDERIVQKQASKTGNDNDHTSNTMVYQSKTDEACDGNNEDVAVEDRNTYVSTDAGSEVDINLNTEAEYQDAVTNEPEASLNMNAVSEAKGMDNVENVNNDLRATENVNDKTENEKNETEVSNVGRGVNPTETDDEADSETAENVEVATKAGKNVEAVPEAGQNLEGTPEATKRLSANTADKETERTELGTGNMKSTETSNDKNNLNVGSESKEGYQTTVQSEDDSQSCKDKLNVGSKTDQPTSTTTEISKVDFKFDELSKEQKKMLGDIKKLCEMKQSKDVTRVGARIIAKEMNINTESEEIMAYISKCIDICWSMHRHVPPVYIYFPSNVTDESFDTKVYRAYTKSGKRIHFVVWPAIHLHEGGPLLGKGVAQGRN